MRSCWVHLFKKKSAFVFAERNFIKDNNLHSQGRTPRCSSLLRDPGTSCPAALIVGPGHIH